MAQQKISGQQLVDYTVMAIIWGFSFLLLRRVIEGFGWVGAVSFRAFIASALLIIFARVGKKSLNFSIGWKPFAVVGATTVAGQLIGMTYAVPQIGTAMAAIFVGAIPIFSMIIGQIWGIEHLNKRGQLGLFLGLAGVVMLVGFPQEPFTKQFIIGCAASVFGSFSAAFGSNYARLRLQQVGSWEQTIGAFFFGGLFTLPLIILVPLPRIPKMSDIGFLILLAALVSSLCYVLYFRMVAAVGATRAISIEFVVTVIAVSIGALILHERLSILQLIGGAVIILGCSLVLDLIPHNRTR